MSIGLPELILGTIKKAPESDTESKNESREDLIAAFADIENKELPAVERMDAMKLFIELSGRKENPFKD